MKRLAGRLMGARERTRPGGTTLRGEIEKAGLDYPAWLSRARGSRRLYCDLPEESLRKLKKLFPDHVKRLLASAERILRHEFDLLGSGPFVPVDTGRPRREDGYAPIDWRLDPVKNLRFPGGIHYRKWNLYEMRPGLADIKHPWELSRLHHLVTLGQAYRLSEDRRFANEIGRQMEDFIEANPAEIGINWTCAMDVAIRAANWAMALSMIREWEGAGDGFWMTAYDALYEHGCFVRHNLENTYEVTSNHYLSDICGLYYLSAVFSDLEAGREWGRYAKSELEKEITTQVYPEGADFESSIPYHRLVTELFMGAARLAEFRGEPMTNGYMARLGGMVKFLAAVTRPDGLMPQVGDADDGRLHIFTRYGDWDPQDGMSVLGAASRLLDDESLRGMAGEDGAWEAAWWGCEVEAEAAVHPVLPAFAGFPESGVYVARDERYYLLITNGKVGTAGFGNHKHNDLLSFEYHILGRPFVVDPGSYVYTGDPEARNLFRSARYHNTVMVDGLEPNEMNPEWLFRLTEKANPETLEWSEDDEGVTYIGFHDGYRRTDAKARHVRVFRLLKNAGALIVMDALEGRGRHMVNWHFHLAPGVAAREEAGGIVRLVSGDASVSVYSQDGVEGKIAPAWYSPSYGRRMECLAMDYSIDMELDGAGPRWFIFALGSEGYEKAREGLGRLLDAVTRKMDSLDARGGA